MLAYQAIHRYVMIKPISAYAITYIISTRVAFFLPSESSCHAQLVDWIVGWISLTSQLSFFNGTILLDFELILPLAHNNSPFLGLQPFL